MFSLGVVLSMLVQGRHPFAVPDDMDQQYADGWMDIEERHLYEEELQNAKLQRSRVFEDYVDPEVWLPVASGPRLAAAVPCQPLGPHALRASLPRLPSLFVV